MATKLPPRLQALYDTDQTAFLREVRKILPKIVFPHDGQKVVLNSKARFRVMNCGRRWGKTVLAAKIIVEASRKERQMLWWVAPTYKITKRGYEEVLRQLPAGVLARDAPPASNFDAGRSVILYFKNGTKMEFYSAERPEGMLGAAVDFCVMDEAAIMPGRIWNQIVQPTLIDHNGRALMISTPRGYNWFHDVWAKGQDPQQKLWESWTFTTQDNPTLPEGAADELAADMPRMEADQEIYAKWLAAGSSVFYIPERSVQLNATILDSCLVEETPPAGHIVLGVDLARTNDYTVIYGARARDRRNCYFERMQAITWPEQKRRIRRAVAQCMRAGATGVTLMVDSTGVGDPVKEDLEADGYDVVGINFTTHKTNMVRLLAKDIEESRAFLLDEQFTEFRNYTMTQTPSGRMTYSAPENQHDDVVAAKMLQHWGLVQEGVPEVQTVSADSEDDQYDDTSEFDAFDDEEDDGLDLYDDLVGFDDSAEFAVPLEQARAFTGWAQPERRPSPEDVFAAEEPQRRVKTKVVGTPSSQDHRATAQQGPHQADFLLG